MLQGTEVITEGGGASATIDAKTPKLINGNIVKVVQKLDISGGNAKSVSEDIKNLLLTINSKLHFWKPNNPFVHSGEMFNGSSKHLMNPKLHDKLESVKPTFGDIDVIVPIQKFPDLEKYLDSMDDNKVDWHPNDKNKVTAEFNYIGRTKSFKTIPDQRFTFWWYRQKRQVVQIDFEGDKMSVVEIDGQKFQKPSFWIKFSKDSPWEDLEQGVKGLAGAIMLRALARSTSQLENSAVLTTSGVQKFLSHQPLTPRDISKDKRHDMASNFIFNPGATGAGLRRAYKKLGTLPDGRDAYMFVEPKMISSLGKEFDYITDVNVVFQMIFGRSPSTEDIKNFRSLGGLLNLIKQNLNKKTIVDTLKKFKDLIDSQPISDSEKLSITRLVKKYFN